MTIRGLSVQQPFAQLITLGAKTIETRSFHRKYTGWLAIHAAKRFPREFRYLCAEPPYSLYTPCVAHLPLGAIVAVARLDSIHRHGG